jgi:hypothetical protein
MCRSIKKLRVADQPPATRAEIRAAALQFVRKVSGFHTPSEVNRAAFERAVDEITSVTESLLGDLPAARNRSRVEA